MKRLCGLLLLVGMLAAAPKADAALLFTFSETGGNVRVDYSGSLDLTGLSFTTFASGLDEHALRYVTPGFGEPYTAFINLYNIPSPRLMTFSNAFASLPGVYHSSNALIASSYGGTAIHLPTASNATNATLRFDSNDVVNNIWTGSGFMQWNNTTIAALGIDASPKTWVLNNAAADTITMVPEPGALCTLGLGSIALMRRRRR